MSANEILPNLWLGDKTASQSTEFLKSMKIGLVVNCTKDIPFNAHLSRSCTKLRVPVHDNLDKVEIANLAKFAPQVIGEIWRHYSNGIPVFIHCYAGVQRSAAITSMFLIFYQRCSSDDAINHIRRRRPIAFRPGINFHTAILKFETRLNQTLVDMTSF